MDTIRWSDPLSTSTCLPSGIARLSGPIWDRANRVTQVCHLERIVPKNTIAELAVWEIGPITSVRAPRNYAGRSPQGREDNLRKVAGQIGGLR